MICKNEKTEYIIGLRACKVGSRVPASFQHVRAVPSCGRFTCVFVEENKKTEAQEHESQGIDQAQM